MTSIATGRNIRTVSYMEGKNQLAPLETIVKSISNGGYDLRSKHLSISERDLVGWHRTEYESLTMILLVDVSKSTWPFIEVFTEILKSLTGYFNKNNDRVGLISLQGLQARVFNHPTHNFRVVARGLGKLKFHGETPIADGLLKSLSMARLERNKNPGAKSIVILLSDCYPEPVARGVENVFDDPAYRSSINAAATYKRARLMLLVVNPAFASEEAKRPGEILADRMVRVSGGRLIKLIRPSDRRYVRPSRREMDQIIHGIETSFSE